MLVSRLFDQASKLGFDGYRYPAGASAGAIADLEAQVGHMLPASLKAMWLCHDGEVRQHGEDSPELFFGFPLLSVAQSLDFWDGARQAIAMDARLGDDEDRFVSRPPGSLSKARNCTGWVPFAGLYAPSHLAIDYAPGPNGVVGQIIFFSRDDSKRTRIALSFDDLLAKVLQAYASHDMHPAFGWDLDKIFDLPPV